MKNQKGLLIIFTRNPEPGKVKKRLAARIGDSAALELYKFLLKHTFEVTKDMSCDKVIYYSESIEKEDIWDHNIFQKKKQSGKDLGERMKNAFTEGFEAGYSNIVIIGSDLYDLQKEDLEKAFSSLYNYDYAVGPAQDGGYYLLGMKSLNSKLFRNKKWGTDTVLQETLQDLKNEQLKLLEERNDIDTYEDLIEHPELHRIIKYP
ncbi:TIGR04282 family arsenosugar biosynthesis glycosyltransferase [Salinimicrobium flavum]|uniref:TIGR04282 family arsenosugar biosynthesis glycosyltransferase n=1 Tax=Salinimicrobium flavum TaxID=1737065 RepID=A0ABW5IU48_9FLAO